MKQDAPTHPSRKLLLGYAQGRLTGDESGPVEAHLSECDACLQVLDEVAPCDPLVNVLRSLPFDGPSKRFAPVMYPVQPAAAPKEADPPVELSHHPRYRLGDFVGGGGMGQVWKAQHLLMDRTVAIKIIHPRLLKSVHVVARFHREVRAAARLEHPHIVRAYDADVIGDLHFLVMEYVDGMNLAALVAAKGPLPLGEACACIRQAAQGLQHAHEHGVVHRDIKPQNLMLTGGVVKILDFGLACFKHDRDRMELETLPEGSGSLTGFDTAMGTPDYLAPEQAADARRADIRADIYSLGCTFYFLLTGRAPFAGARDFRRRDSTPPTPLTQHRPDVPETLARIVERMLAGEQSRRFQTPAEIVAALAPFESAAVSRPASRQRLWVPAAALVCLLIAGWIVANALSPGGKAPVAVSDPISQLPTDTDRRAQDDKSQPATRELRCLNGHTDQVRSIMFAPDGKHLLSSSKDGTVREWDLETGQEKRRFLDQGKAVGRAVYSPDGQRVYASTLGNSVRVWEVKGGEELKSLLGLSPSFTPDGTRLLTYGSKSLFLWDAKTGKHLLRRKIDQGAVAHVLLPDGRRAFYGSANSGVIFLIDLATGMEHPMEGSAPGLNALALSPDGAWLLSCAAETAVRVWDLSAGKKSRCLLGHTDVVKCVAVSPDGQRALSGGNDRSVRLWDIGRQEQLASFEGHTDVVLAVAFAPDGKRAASGSQDTTIRVWRLPE